MIKADIEGDLSILGIIPARGGSKGVKRKNIRLFGNKPLIQWTIDEAKKSKYINRLIVSTEDQEIREVCQDLGVEVIDRPVELAQDESTTVDTVIHALDVLKEKGYHPDLTVLLQCTSPLRRVKHIDEAIEIFLNNIQESNSIVSVMKEEHPPWWLQKIDRDGYLKKLLQDEQIRGSRRQDFPDTYRLNGSIYVIKTKELYLQRSYITDKTIPYIMDSRVSIDIDKEEDFMFAELIAHQNNIEGEFD